MAHKNKQKKSLPKFVPEVVSLSGPTSPVLFQTSTPNEPVSAQTTTAIVTRDEADLISDVADEDTLSSSIARMSNDELHKEIIRTYANIVENVGTYKALVLDARRRMAAGDKVGGYTTWGEYADLYLKRIDESLPTCLRRLRRVLEGVNPDTKHRNKRRKFKSTREIVEEGRERQVATELSQARDRGFQEGRAAERQAQQILAKKAADEKPPFAVSHSPIDQSETWSRDEASRRIIAWALSCLKGFSRWERRRIVEDVIAKLRDDLAFEDREISGVTASTQAEAEEHPALAACDEQCAAI